MGKYKILLFIILFNLLFNLPLFAREYNLSSEVLFNLGKDYLKQNRYAEAKYEFEKCLMLDPNNIQAKELLEWCESELKEEAMLLALEKAEKSIKPEISTKVAKIKEVIPAPSPRKDKAMTAALDSVAPPKEPEKIAREKEKPKEVTPPEKEPLAPTFERIAWALKQGTWHLKKGDFYGELYTKYYWHKYKFNDNGTKERWDYDGRYNEIRTELKLEYGLTDRYTLMLYTVAKEAHWKDDFKSCTRKGFVEMWPGVKYLLFDDPFFCWLRLRAKFPLHYSEEATPALEKHQIDGEFKILTAQPWLKLPGYTKFELGFKGRNEEPTNEIIYFTQLGYNLTKNLILELALDGQEGLAQTGGLDEDWIKATFGPIFKVGFLNIKLGYGNTFAGKNTSAAQEVYSSIYTFW